MVEPPYEAVPLSEALWWHPVHTHDAAHIWLRETAARESDEPRSGRHMRTQVPANPHQCQWYR